MLCEWKTYSSSECQGISGLVTRSGRLCELLPSTTFVSVDLFQSILLLCEGLKNQGSTGVINMRDKPSRGEGLCKLTCINWWITDLLVRRRQKMQTPWVFFGFYMLLCPLRTTVLKGSHQPWGEVGLMRWSFSQFHCTRQHSWKIPVTAPYSCLHKCSLQCVLALLWTIPGLGFNHFIGSLFPFPTGLLVGFFPAPLSSPFHSLFPAEEPLTARSQAHFRYFSLWTVLPFSIQYFCRAARTGGIVSAVPHCKHQCM